MPKLVFYEKKPLVWYIIFFSVKDKAFTLLNNLCGFALTNELIFNQGKPQTQPSNVNCMNIGTLYLQSVATHLAGILAERRDTRPIFGQNIAFFWKLLEALFNLSVGFMLQPAYLDVGALKIWNVN